MNPMALMKALCLTAILAFQSPAQAKEEVFRLGIIGLDTSHVIAFTQIINNPENNYSCKVVAGFPGGSPDMPASADRVDKFTSQLRDRFGVEIVETIEQLCEKVARFRTEGVDMVVGTWKDGRIGTFRDLRGGKSTASVRIYGTKGMIEAKSSGYKPLVDEIVRFFKTGEVPVSAEETIEIYAFMSAADVSKAKNGAVVSLDELIEKARRQNEERRAQKTRCN